MNFKKYQLEAKKTAVYADSYRIMYPSLGLAGESGEVANKVKKIYRDDDGVPSESRIKAISKEIGGVLWYVANLCADLGLSMDEIASENIAILNSRKERGTIHGDGDDR